MGSECRRVCCAYRLVWRARVSSAISCVRRPESLELTGRDIICLSTHYWDERGFRKQEFMSPFAEGNRILYVEPSFSMARPYEANRREGATNRYVLSRLEDRDSNIHLLKPPRGLPKWAHPRIERANYRWYGRIVGRVARRL